MSDDWRADIITEAAGGAKAEVVKNYRVIGNPAHINRQGEQRRTPCPGGCGARTWGDTYCRKCERRMEREARKRKVRHS